MTDDRTSLAAANNAVWCSVVSRAHGLTDVFDPDYWLQRGRSLPLYPNLVTLTRDGLDRQRAAIERDAVRPGTDHWSVKDSFNALNLSTLGFRVLFQAEWFYGDAGIQTIGRAERCRRSESGEELRAWETAWNQKPPEWPPGGRVFPSSLLEDDRVAFLYSIDDQGITGGLVANYGADSIGISNTFTRRGEADSIRTCLLGAAETWPDTPLVGYAGSAELAVLEGLGFQRLTPLRVWVR